MSIKEAFWWGVFGGGCSELLAIFKLRQRAMRDWPKWSKMWSYWVISGVWVFLGGLLVVAYLNSDVKLSPILAINLGASTPLIIERVFSQAPPIEPGTVN
jgi:hypothetical protein